MKKLLFIALLLICPQLAHAASQRNPCYTTGALSTNGQQNCIDVGTSTPLPVTGTVTTSGTQTVQGVTNVTPTDCSGAITTGGTAQNAFAANANIHGFTISNIDNTSGSGEPIWISFTGTAATGAAGSYPLAVGAATSFSGVGTFTTPIGFGSNKALSVIAATTGHKFSCTWW